MRPNNVLVNTRCNGVYLVSQEVPNSDFLIENLFGFVIILFTFLI